MSISTKQRPKTEPADDSALPPLDHDEAGEADPETLCDYLDPEPDSESLLDAEERFLAEPDLAGERSIPDGSPDSWIAEEEGPADFEVDLESDGEVWVEKGADAPVTLEGEWMMEEEESAGGDDDGGAEGPLAEEAFYLESEGDPLGSAEGRADPAEDDEEVIGAMKRLGIELPSYAPEEADAARDTGPGLVLDQAFLGPDDHAVFAAAFLRGSPVAVGDGLFVLGADGMLHPQVGSERIARLAPTSIFVHGSAIFLGTAYGGALKVEAQEQRLTPLNSWYTHGLTGGVEPPQNRLSTTFTLHGQARGGDFRLLGLTGEGQLFVSEDHGAGWRSLRIRGRCLMVRPVDGAPDILALAESRDRRRTLQKSRELESWQPIGLPGALADGSQGNRLLAAASGSVLIAAEEAPGLAAFRSLDHGRRWEAIDRPGPLTALALDPEEPLWAAAASFDPQSGLGTVWVSADGGRQWQAVLTTGRSGDAAGAENPPRERSANRVSDLVIDVGRTRQLIAVTRGGIYLAILARPGVSH